MAAAEEDEARDAAKAAAAASSSSPAPPAEEKIQTESKEEECKADALTPAAKSDPSAVPAPSSSSADQLVAVAPLTSPVVTEPWFDSYSMALALLDAMCTDGAKLRLPMGVALAATGVPASSSPFASSPPAERTTAAATMRKLIAARRCCMHTVINSCDERRVELGLQDCRSFDDQPSRRC